VQEGKRAKKKADRKSDLPFSWVAPTKLNLYFA
jgi:hypothetical protein